MANTTTSVDIVVAARDKASAHFKAIGTAAGGMASMIRKAAAAAAVYFGARAMIRFGRESAEAYMIQEKAVTNLTNALRLLGKENEIAELEKFASSIQSITTVGDEAVMELMQLGASIGGLSGDILQKATKAAIGFSKAFGIDSKAAMLLVAKAAAGNTSTLSRYGIILNQSLSQQEKFNQVLEIGNKNFALATGETKTLAGALAQAKNAWDDLKEEVGQALAPYIIASAQKIKKWSEENQDAVFVWVSKSMAFLKLLKDGLMAFIDFMKNDWKSAFKWVFDSMLIIMKTAFESAVDMSIAAGKGIWKGVKEGLQGGREGKVQNRALEIYQKSGGPLGEQLTTKTGPGGLSSYYTMEKTKPLNEVLWQTAKLQAEREINQEIRQGIMGNLFANIKEDWKEAILEIAQNTPKGLGEGFAKAMDEYLKQLAEINGSRGLPGGGGGSQNMMAAMIGMLGGGRGVAAVESRFLTGGAGTDYQKETAQYTKQNAKATERLLSKIDKLIEQGNAGQALDILFAKFTT